MLTWMNTIPACAIWTSTEPTTAPNAVPTPPNRLVPPRTAAVITSNSRPTPNVRFNRPISAISITPPIPAQMPQITYTENVTRPTWMPAFWAASRSLPTAYTWRPTWVRVRVRCATITTIANTTIGIGMPRIEDAPNCRNTSGNWIPNDSVIAVPSPRPATSVASVTRNGVIRRPTMHTALTTPNNAPASTATT